MICNYPFNEIVCGSNQTVRLVSSASMDLFNRGYLNYQNRPRRVVFNIEAVRAIKKNLAHSIKNRSTINIKKTEAGDIA